ncbi:MAG: hypothetical protein HYZ16_11270 [Bacteroidetes bacterium]|jgi:hypothetical protein|nr:hypothetical protein [Bacteroidota bacterium]
MENGARIRINRENGEIEISGSEKFVSDHISLVRSVLGLDVATEAPAKAREKKSVPTELPKPKEEAVATPVDFPAAPPTAEEPVRTKRKYTKSADKKAGRPSKKSAVTTEAEPGAEPKKRGRPKKVQVEVAEEVEEYVERPLDPDDSTEPLDRDAAFKPVETVAQSVDPSELEKKDNVRVKPPRRKASSTETSVPNSFGAFMNSFRRKLKKGDYILAAGYYFTTSTNSETFSTFNTSKLLKAQGIGLANPSQYMKNNTMSGRVEQIDKRNYKVTDEGVKHLSKLMGK